VGVMLPQPEVRTARGEKMLLDDVLGTGFALLRLHENPEEAFVTTKACSWKSLGVRFVSIEKEISDFILNRRDLFALVRPDRYICAVFKKKQAEAYASAFRKKLASAIKWSLASRFPRQPASTTLHLC
jgi:hypothetical protein